MNEERLVRLSTNPAATWWIRHVASRLDPWLFRATGGRLTSFGPPTMPMLTLTTAGRRTGRRRSVHLACVPHAGDHLVVASAMGQARHPAWRHNLAQSGEAEVQIRGERFAVRAERLSETERAALWPELRRAIPQLAVYEQRTSRDIDVFRLRRNREDRA